MQRNDVRPTRPESAPDVEAPVTGLSDDRRLAGARQRETFPWVSSRTLQFTFQGKFELAFPRECPLLLHFLQFSLEHRLTPSYHDYPEIAYVFEGSGQFMVENKTYAVASGDLVIIGSQEFHLMRAGRRGPVKVISIHFLPELLHRPGTPMMDFGYLQPFFFRGPSFSHRIAAAEMANQPILDRIRRMTQEIRLAAPDYPLAVKTYLADILFIVARHYRSAGMKSAHPRQTMADIRRLRKVFDYLAQHYHEPIPLALTARMACLSPNAFCRYFKRVTGNTLSEYRLRLRIDRAMELLSGTSQPITEIAYALGFSSHSHFDRAFARLTGLCPLRFRRQSGL